MAGSNAKEKFNTSINKVDTVDRYAYRRAVREARKGCTQDIDVSLKYVALTILLQSCMLRS